MIYYEILEDGSIGRYTNSEKIAQKYGWSGQTGKTEKEILQEITKLKPRDLDELKAAKLLEIDKMTKQHITGGFKSAAKGTMHIYGSTEVDQLTFSAMYAASKSPDFETTEPYHGQIPIRTVPEGQREKIVIWHSATQMQKVIDDLALHIGRCKQIGWKLQEQAKAAVNPSELKKISWP